MLNHHSFLTLALCLPACAHTKLPLLPISGCDQPCAVVSQVTFPDEVELTVEAPAGARLQNATIGSSSGSRCAAGVPVAQVLLDQVELPEGPASIGGLHELLLRFPFTNDLDARKVDLPLPVVIDLNLALPDGQPRCLRVAMPADDESWTSLARRLSYRLHEGQ